MKKFFNLIMILLILIFTGCLNSKNITINKKENRILSISENCKIHFDLIERIKEVTNKNSKLSTYLVNKDNIKTYIVLLNNNSALYRTIANKELFLKSVLSLDQDEFKYQEINDFFFVKVSKGNKNNYFVIKNGDWGYSSIGTKNKKIFELMKSCIKTEVSK